MRQVFGINTNLFETNILNLGVVVRVVVTVLGDSLKSLLDQRLKKIVTILEETDKKVAGARNDLDEALKFSEIARFTAQEIRVKALESVEREKLIIRDQLKRDLQRFNEIGQKIVQLERQKAMQVLIRRISNLALDSAEDILFMALVGSKDMVQVKQIELNEIRVRETLNKLKEGFLATKIETV
jgi:F-type H+-transporting ATPase subunit b